jgi:hypothetical protein
MLVIVVVRTGDGPELALGEVVADLDQGLLLVGQVEEGGGHGDSVSERSFRYLNACSGS